MMRWLVALLFVASCTSTPADPMAIYFANTVLVTQPYGETDRILLNADHTYTMYGIRFGTGHGRWSLENNQVCLMPGDTPETSGQKFCNAWSGAHIGDRWTMTVSGQTIPMQIAAGRMGAFSTHP